MYNRRRTVSLTLAAIHWTITVALGIAGTMSGDVRPLFWGLLSGMVACVLTSQTAFEATMHNERVRIEHLVDGLIAAAQTQVNGEVRHLH